MASTNLSRVLALPLALAACSFQAGGLGSAGLGDSDGSSGATSEASATTGPALTTSVGSEPSGGATELTMASGDPSTDPLTTTDPTTTTVDPGSTTDVPASCGDGELDPGEQCDAGPLNGDDQACTAACLNNVCGDGKQGPGEGCDDGNQLPDDGCSPMCVSEDCGDGDQQPGEACDDGNQIDDDGCTNACTLPACGDKIVQADETCDDGGETAQCDSDCSAVTCGDGTVNKAAGEECDDGNNVATDACTDVCKPAACGDGVVQAGVEACDDGNAVDSDACSNMCTINGLRVFVSSETYNGNLAGLAGADGKCQALANAANLGGKWMAWLSDGATGPATRFTTKGGSKPYVRIDGKLVANDWADLIDGKLTNPINVTEANMPAAGPTHVWTNTAVDGTPSTVDKHCLIWLNPTGASDGENGLRANTDAKWTDENNDKCSDLNRIYCFEQ